MVILEGQGTTVPKREKTNIIERKRDCRFCDGWILRFPKLWTAIPKSQNQQSFRVTMNSRRFTDL